MNYYPFHVGDYLTHTAHLSPIEDIAYRRLLDLYYISEEALPCDVSACARKIRMREHEAEVRQVLEEFFRLTDDGWFNGRCDDEIAAMRVKQEKARASAAASVNARRAKADRSLNDDETNAQRTLNERSTTVKLPIPTPTPTPIKEKGETPDKPARFDPLAMELPSSLPLEIWERWIAYRRKRKLTTAEPTMRAQIANIVEWSSKHQCDPAEIIDASIANGWQGLFEPKYGHSAPRKPRMNVIGVDAETPEGFQDGFR